MAIAVKVLQKKTVSQRKGSRSFSVSIAPYVREDSKGLAFRV